MKLFLFFFSVYRVVLVHLRGFSQHAVQREICTEYAQYLCTAGTGERIDQILVPVQQGQDSDASISRALRKLLEEGLEGN